jgi:hypothetical protein
MPTGIVVGINFAIISVDDKDGLASVLPEHVGPNFRDLVYVGGE